MTGVRARATVLALACCLGCDGPRGHETFSAERSGVVGGEISPPGREDGVLLLRTVADDRELICTASLVAKNLALTARHCVSHLTEGLFSCSVSGELMDDGTGAGQLGAYFEAGSLEFYAGATPRTAPLAHGALVLSTLSETICLNDLAFVVLDGELDLPVMPLRIGRPAHRDELVTLVGYGLDETMSQTAPFELALQPRRHKTDLSVFEVGPDSLADGVTTAPPRTIVLQGPSGCLGDSGGPLLDQATGAVLGVYSLLGAESCLAVNARNLFVHVPAFRTLIDEAFAAAGAEPLLEPEPRALGELCDVAEDCAGRHCVELDGDRRCTQACARTSPCPRGFECTQSDGNAMVCAPAPGDGGESGAGGSGNEGGAGDAGAGAGAPAETGGAGGGAEPPSRRPRGGCSLAAGPAPSSLPAPVGLLLVSWLVTLERRARGRRPRKPAARV